MAAPIALPTGSVRVGASIGAALAVGSVSAETLLCQAGMSGSACVTRGGSATSAAREPAVA